MTVIDSYLDTLFAPYPDSPRLREARGELREMMEDKQQDLMARGLSESQAVGQVIAEFGSLEEVSEDLGIAGELRGPRFGADAERTGPAEPTVEPERIEAFIGALRGTRGLLATAVPLFVLSSVPLLLLIAASGRFDDQPETAAVVAGLVLLLLAVATGVVLLVVRGGRLARFADIRERRFTPTAATRHRAEALRAEHAPRRTLGLAVAITLWILCALPVVITGLLSSGTEDPMPLYGVCGTLVMVALGLAIVLWGSWSGEAADALEQKVDEDDLTESAHHPAIRVIAAVYWPIVTAVFLAWGLIGNSWDVNWIIWPVAGVLYGGLWALNAALGSGDRLSAGRRAAGR